jgi:hypothetical protein
MRLQNAARRRVRPAFPAGVPMDLAAIAAALVAAQSSQTQIALATQMVKMNADAQAAVVQLVDAAQQNMNTLANVAPGIGGSLDISV